MGAASLPMSTAHRTYSATGAPSGEKSARLPRPPGNQDERAIGTDTLDRGDGRTDVGPLGVVDPAHATVHRDGLAPMWQSREILDRSRHRVEVETDGVAQCERRENVRDVVHPRQGNRVDRQDGAVRTHDPGCVSASGHMPSRPGRRIRAEPDCRAVPATQSARQGVVEVGDHHGPVAEYPALRGDVIVKGPVAVHVVGTEVEHCRGRRTQRARRLELEARQLEHVELVTLPEQRERGRTQVASDSRSHPGGSRHGADERGDGALAVRAGDGDHRRVGGAGEELDVADDRDAPRRRCLQRRLPGRQAGTEDNLVGGLEQWRVEPPAMNLEPRELGLDRPALRRTLARVHRDDPAARLGEVTDARQSRVAQPDDENMAGRGGHALVERATGTVQLVRVHRPLTGSSAWTGQ